MHANTEALAGMLKQQYLLRFQKQAEYRQSVWKILCRDFFARLIPTRATVFDLGSGWGEFINNIPAARKFAMDLNPQAAESVGPDVTFFHRDCSETWPIADGSLDVVFTSNFLEHLPSKDSVEKTLREAHRCLAPAGMIICLGPNVKFVPGAYWDFWDHHVALTELSLTEVLTMTGFNIEFTIPRFLPYSMSTGKTPPLLALRLYLKLPLLWSWFGKQFLVAARKG